ncbi:hypothetical protein A2U01_0084224, partial [Trifolium medium]|nr:hypothetical protein [Trifolium medium]
EWVEATKPQWAPTIPTPVVTTPGGMHEFAVDQHSSFT